MKMINLKLILVTKKTSESGALIQLIAWANLVNNPLVHVGFFYLKNGLIYKVFDIAYFLKLETKIDANKSLRG